MESCARLYGHDGNHITGDGVEFIDDGKIRPYRADTRQMDEMTDITQVGETVPADRKVLPQSKVDGLFSVQEEIGVAVVNPRGVAAGDKKAIIE